MGVNSGLIFLLVIGGVLGQEDVLKGKSGREFLQQNTREKRYIGRIPVAYMKKTNVQPYEIPGPSRVPVSHFRQYEPHGRVFQEHLETAAPDPSRLSDEEIQTLLLMLDGNDLNKLPQMDMDMDKLAQMYAAGRKRETGKRGDADGLAFLGDGRWADGGKSFMRATRFKKETPLGQQGRPKKAIDWSEYFGIDKRGMRKDEEKTKEADAAEATATAAAAKGTAAPAPAPAPTSNKGKLVAIPLTSTAKVDKAERLKEEERKENHSQDKNWMMNEFYKNFAMMTNVKRKRAAVAAAAAGGDTADVQRLEQLENEMTQVGDKIIWDALKYTGAHADEPMSPNQLEQLKAKVIAKLSAAYSLEKVKEAVEELRGKLQGWRKSEMGMK